MDTIIILISMATNPVNNATTLEEYNNNIHNHTQYEAVCITDADCEAWELEQLKQLEGAR